MTFVLARGGLLGPRIENSIEAFKAALDAGLDGFTFSAQPTMDAVCVAMEDMEMGRTTDGGGLLRKMKYGDLPRLKNGEAVPKLLDALEMPAKEICVELIGEPGWKSALAAVEASDALGRVCFASMEHSEALQLWAACPKARCGFIWSEVEADGLSEEEVSGLPPNLHIHVPLGSLLKRREFRVKKEKRLVAWGAVGRGGLAPLGFEPLGCVLGPSKGETSQ
jgi:glycerophosphoryl diester phosphodiesterase